MLANIDQRLKEAIQSFWDAREQQQQKQVEAGTIDAGTRGAVTGGTQMGALETLLTDILIEAGLDPLSIRARTSLELPGYFRPEKKWDLLVVVDEQLLMAVEFKSQVGPSFGNNFNNRTEEAIGNAEDIWTAYREGLFGMHQAPFLGFFSFSRTVRRFTTQSAIRSHILPLTLSSRERRMPNAMRSLVNGLYWSESTVPYVSLSQRKNPRLKFYSL